MDSLVQTVVLPATVTAGLAQAGPSAISSRNNWALVASAAPSSRRQDRMEAVWKIDLAVDTNLPSVPFTSQDAGQEGSELTRPPAGCPLTQQHVCECLCVCNSGL